jgi:hypothetical protein
MTEISSISGSLSVQSLIAELPSAAQGSVVSLEQRLIQGYAQGSVGVAQDHAAINAMLARPDITNPEVLAQLQVRMADYNLDVNMINTLVRKAVATAETLLRSS